MLLFFFCQKKVITIKARVVRPETFVLEPLGGGGAAGVGGGRLGDSAGQQQTSLDFGDLVVGEKSPTLQFSVRNTSTRRRNFVIQAGQLRGMLQGMQDRQRQQGQGFVGQALPLEEWGCSVNFWFWFQGGGFVTSLSAGHRVLLEVPCRNETCLFSSLFHSPVLRFAR